MQSLSEGWRPIARKCVSSMCGNCTLIFKCLKCTQFLKVALVQRPSIQMQRNSAKFKPHVYFNNRHFTTQDLCAGISDRDATVDAFVRIRNEFMR